MSEDNLVRRVIWADDTPQLRSRYVGILRGVCEQEGITVEVEEVGTGLGLFARVADPDLHYDLIFTYNNMPHRDQGLRALKQIFDYGYTGVAYLVSDTAALRSGPEAISLGAAGYISKCALDIEGELRKVVRKYLAPLTAETATP